MCVSLLFSNICRMIIGAKPRQVLQINLRRLGVECMWNVWYETKLVVGG